MLPISLLFLSFRSVDGKAFMLAFTRLVLCLNFIDAIPDYQSILSNFPSFLITVLTTKEFQQRLEMFLTDFQQPGRIVNSSIDGDVVKECFSRVIQHLELIVGGEVLTGNCITVCYDLPRTLINKSALQAFVLLCAMLVKT